MFWITMICPWLLVLLVYANLSNTHYTASRAITIKQEIVLQAIPICQPRPCKDDIGSDTCTSRWADTPMSGGASVLSMIRSPNVVRVSLHRVTPRWILLWVFPMICAITQPYNHGQQSYRSSTLDCYWLRARYILSPTKQPTMMSSETLCSKVSFIRTEQLYHSITGKHQYFTH